MAKSRAAELAEEEIASIGDLAEGPSPLAALSAEDQIPLAERLAEQIAISILNGALTPGQRVREQDLSAMYNVSRGTVREALRILEGDGFVEIEPYRGAVVTRNSHHEVSVAVEIQIALFGIAARIAAERATEEEIAELASLVARLGEMETDPDVTPDSFVKMSLRITYHLIHLANSESLTKSMRGVRRLTRPDRWIYAMATPAKQRKAVRQWEGILEAIRSRSPSRAESLAKTRVRQIHANTAAAD